MSETHSSGWNASAVVPASDLRPETFEAHSLSKVSISPVQSIHTHHLQLNAAENAGTTTDTHTSKHIPICRAEPRAGSSTQSAEPAAGNDALSAEKGRLQAPDQAPNQPPDARSMREKSWSELDSHRHYRYFLSDDPRTTLRRVCAYCLHNFSGDNRGNPAAAEDLLRRLRMTDIHGVGDWPVQLREMLVAMHKRTTVHKGKKRVLTFFLSVDIETVIPPSERVSRRQRQKLTTKELAYVAKTITAKVLDNWRRSGKASAFLKGRYFCKSGYADAYRKATGRRLNVHKISAITELLEKYEFVQKSYPKNDKGQRSGTVYRLGGRNYYQQYLV